MGGADSLPSPLISYAYSLKANAELYILVSSLTKLLSVFLPLEEGWKYMSILML